MKGRLGGMELTLQKENVAVDNGRCQESHVLMPYTYLEKLDN